jgi:demethylmenaquinone methyltransferase/2-methoxy-6-polyprenyl-1,4-benzoquinol methylase
MPSDQTPIAPDAPDVILGMQAYYAQRAAYYERVYFRPERQTDLRALEAWMEQAFAGRHVLEVATGTGWWTPHGARHAQHWLATDINPETLEVARHKPLPPQVDFALLDAYAWTSAEGQAFDAGWRDAAFAGCWWSHVPLARLRPWLDSLHARLQPGARVVFLDNSFVQTSSTPVSRQDEAGNTYQQRTLDDGSSHEVLKNFPTREQAFELIGPQALRPQWLAFTHYWLLSYELGPSVG